MLAVLQAYARPEGECPFVEDLHAVRFNVLLVEIWREWFAWSLEATSSASASYHLRVHVEVFLPSRC